MNPLSVVVSFVVGVLANLTTEILRMVRGRRWRTDSVRSGGWANSPVAVILAAGGTVALVHVVGAGFGGYIAVVLVIWVSTPFRS